MPRPAPTRPIVLQALLASTDQLGITRNQIAAQTGITPAAVSDVLFRLVKDGLAFRYRARNGWRFFSSREALEAARPATINVCEALRSALQADTSPIGMTTAEIVAATGLTAKQVYAGLYKLPGAARLGAMPDIRHFINAERAEACRPAYEEYMAALRRERKERNQQRHAERSVVYRERQRAEGKTINKPPPPRKAPILDALRAAMAACSDPFGLTNAQFRELTGLTSDQVTNGLLELRAIGEAFVLGRNTDTHYVPTQEARDAAAAAFDVFMSKVKAERVKRAAEVARQLSRQRYYSKAEVQARAERKAAQSKQRQPQATVLPPAKSVPASATKPNFKNLPAIVPPGLQVKRLPGFSERSRFEPPPWFKGEFSKAGIGRYTA
jgi:hypothetical protein